MGVGVKFDFEETKSYLAREVEKHEQRLITMLDYIGQTVVNEIRTSHISNWEDQTGNLRSSIGYMILLDGVPQHASQFPRVDGPKREKTNVDGSAEGKNYMDSLIPLFPKGIALVIVAGMEYASYVEKMQNKTVLAQGEIEAETLIANMVAQLNARLNND